MDIQPARFAWLPILCIFGLLAVLQVEQQTAAEFENVKFTQYKSAIHKNKHAVESSYSSPYELRDIDLPFYSSDKFVENTDVDIEFSIHHSDHIAVYDMITNGCLLGLWKDNRKMLSFSKPLCLKKPMRVALGAPGSISNVKVRLWRTKNTLQFATRGVYDSILAQLRNFFIATILISLAIWALAKKLRSQSNTFLSIGLFGIGLRLLYGLCTSIHQRSYDLPGHLGYISYVTEHWQLPPAGEGWEFFQPPLYYWLLAILKKSYEFWGITRTTFLDHAQLFSILLSIISFAALLWIGTLVFNQKKDRSTLHTYALLCACFPGLVLMASRISNDVLVFPLSLLSLGLLIQWWHNQKAWAWYTAILVLSVALLTKSTAMALVPVFVICFLLRTQKPTATVLKMGAISLLLLISITGPYYAQRHIHEKQTSIVGNSLPGALRVKNTVAHMTTFNPLAVLEHPMNNSWNNKHRRQYFWESFFKSAFTGPWYFAYPMNALINVTHMIAMLVFAGFVYGISKLQKDEHWDYLPITLSLCCLVGSLVLYRLLYPFASNQDFRFIPIIAVGLSLFSAIGVQKLTNAIPVIRVLPWLFSCCCILSLLFMLFA